MSLVRWQRTTRAFRTRRAATGWRADLRELASVIAAGLALFLLTALAQALAH